MAARDEILHRLRTILARPDLRFPAVETRPLSAETRMAVTTARGGAPELTARFASELSELHGASEVVESVAEARMALISRLISWHDAEEAAAKGVRLTTGQEKQVLSWDPQALPLGHLAEALADMGFELVTPKTLATKESREAVRHIRYGLTGVEAAFASTGSMLLAGGGHLLRSASLLPIRHIALIPFSRLYGTIEEWLAAGHHDDLAQFFRTRPNITMITGPSKSADIEMNLTLGVHGPKFVHCILFDDDVRDKDEEDALFVDAYRYRLFREEDSSNAGGSAAQNPKGSS